MVLHNVFKVADIYHRLLDKKTLKWIEEFAEVTYKDKIVTEDLYNIFNTIESISSNDIKCPKKVYADLKKIAKMLTVVDATYLRVTYS